MANLRALCLLLLLCAVACAPAAIEHQAPAPAAAESNRPANRVEQPKPQPKPEPQPEPVATPSPGSGFQAERSIKPHPSGYSRELNVLYVEQNFRWNARYLSEFLKRDSGLAYQGFFLDAQDGWAQPTSQWSDDVRNRVKPLKAPFSMDDQAVTTQDQFLALGHDVIFLGDVDPSSREWRPEFFEWIEDWVKRGGGLVLLAGQRHHPHSYASLEAYNLLCPVLPAAAEETRVADIRELKYLALTEAGEKHDVLRLAESESANRELLGSVNDGKYEAGTLHGHYWHAVTGAAKDDAVVLARAAWPGQPVGDGQPIIVTRDYGKGRVLWIGTDDIHYWRQWVGDHYFYAFFANAIRWAANDPGKPD